MIRKLSLLVILIVMAPVSVVFGKDLEQYEIYTPDKVWSINFNVSLDENTVTSQNVYVNDSSGDKVNTSVRLIDKGKTIEIHPSDDGYHPNTTYLVTVEKAVSSSKGVSLREEIAFTFVYPQSIKEVEADTTDQENVTPVISNLSPLEKKIYNALDSVETEVNVGDITTDSSEIREALWKVVYLPEFSYYSYNGGYTSVDGTIRMDFDYSKDEISEKKKAVDTKLDRIITENVTSNMTDLEKIKAVHDYIINHTVYDYENYLNDTLPGDSYQATGVLLNGTAVCDGYTKALLLLLDKMGYETYYVVGEVDSGLHSWVKVKLDGEWYNIDATWDDPVTQDGSDILRYNYFLVTDEELAKNHYWEKGKLPKADSEKYSYFWGMNQQPIEYEGYYYYNNSDNDIIMYRMGTDGSNNEQFIDQRAMYMVLHDDWIYFSNYSSGARLFRVNVETKKIENVLFNLDEMGYIPSDPSELAKLNKAVKNLRIEGDVLYYEDYDTGEEFTYNLKP